MLRRGPRRNRQRARRSRTTLRSPRAIARLGYETLEDRRLLAVFTVSSLEDTGPGTLRDAIDWANATPGPDEVVFAPSLFQHGPGEPTPGVILLDSALPTVTDSLTITGPGAELLALDGQSGPPSSWDEAGLLAIDAPEVTVEHLTFQNSGWNAAIMIEHGSTAEINEAEFIENGRYQYDESSEEEFGYGAIMSRGDLTVTGSSFIDNGGSAVFADHSNLAVYDSEFHGNSTRSDGYSSPNPYGGAIYATGDTLLVERSVFTENSATEGGAIYSANEGFQFLDSTASGNYAGEGGAIRTASQHVTIRNSTLSGNSAIDGSAILVNDWRSWSQIAQSFTIESSTVVANAVGEWGNGPAVGVNAHEMTFHNSVIADNENGSNADIGLRGDADQFEATHNLIGVYPGGGSLFFVDGVDGNLLGSYDSPVSARLGPLADNGGPTPTHAPMPGSRVIDAGGVFEGQSATDQRGMNRVAHGGVGLRPDIGAYESQAAPTALPGDFNADGRFDAADYTVWRDSHGDSVAPLTAGDADGDGWVTRGDHAVWASQYGQSYYLSSDLVVNDLGDEDDGDLLNGVTTLREAINRANIDPAFDTIIFDESLSGETIVMSSSTISYQIESAMTIDASMLTDGLAIRNDVWSVFTTDLNQGDYPSSTNDDFDVEIVGLTLESTSGFPVVNSDTLGELTLTDVTVRNTRDRLVYHRGALTLVDSLVESSRARGEATGIAAVDSPTSVTMIRSAVRGAGSTAVRGGLSPFSYPTLHANQPGNEVVRLVDSEITGVPDVGIEAYGNVHLERSRVEGNLGGGIVTHSSDRVELPWQAGNVTLVDSSVSGNSSPLGQRPSLDGSRLLTGGAGIAAAGDVSLTRSRVENNAILSNDDAKGGGIAAIRSVHAVDSWIDGNSAATGAGIYTLGLDREGQLPTADEDVVSLVGSSVSNNTAEGNGSGWPTGAAIHTWGSIRIEGSSISGNEFVSVYEDEPTVAIVMVDDFGADASISIADSVLAGNVGPSRMQVVNSFAGGAGSIAIERSHVIDNQMDGVTATTIVDSTVSRNDGVGVYLSGRMERTTVSGNQDVGVFATPQWPSAVIVDSTIRGNDSESTPEEGLPVGGVYSQGGVTLVGTTVTDNSVVIPEGPFVSGVYAGGVYASEVRAIDSTIAGNTVRDDRVEPSQTEYEAVGGVHARGNAYLYGSTVSGNQAVSASGGVAPTTGGVLARSVELWQSTISGNHAIGEAASGGGVQADVLTSTHSTIANNTASDEGGGAAVAQTIALEGTIVAGNTAPSGPDLRYDWVGNRTVNHSIVGDPSGFEHDPSMGEGNLLGVDPLLGPLADSGGPTETHALLPGSPAIDAGDPAATNLPTCYWLSGPEGSQQVTLPGFEDQRGLGFPRVLDGGSGVARIDIGAVEAPTPAAATAAAFAWSPTPSAPQGEQDAASGSSVNDEPAARDAALLLLLDSQPPGAEGSVAVSGVTADGEEPRETEDRAFDTTLGVF